jgi:hypothetical protein
MLSEDYTMNRPLLLSLPQEALRSKIVDTIRKHWQRPHLVESPELISPPQVEAVSRQVLDAMLTRPFRVGPLPHPEVYAKLLKRVCGCVRHNEPVTVTVGYGPLKNQHAVSYSRADWAEFFALCHLVAWHNKVQAVYAPGLRIKICFDDSTLLMANQADRTLMESYMKSIPALIQALGYEAVIIKCFGQSSFSWSFHFGLYPLARLRVWWWERNPAHRAQMEKMDEYARRNVMVPPELEPAAQERYLRRASHRYRVYWDALQLSRIFWGPFKLIAMYLDGSQHHQPQAVAVHLTTLDKGQVTQPWQGEGALVDNGHGKLEPFVLTAGRRFHYDTREVAGLDVVPCPGFERIRVAFSQATPGTANAAVPQIPANAIAGEPH